jgi:hypothetical protein
MILAQFAEMIVILLNNPRYIILRPAVLNMSTLLFLNFKIRIKLVSSLEVGAVETQSSAFPLFAVIMAVVTGVYFCLSCELFAARFELQW